MAGSGQTGPSAGAQPGAAAKAGPGTLVRIPLTLTLTGDYLQSVAFIKRIQTQMPRAVLITSLQLAGTGNDLTNGTTTMTITGAVFSIVQPTPAPSASSATSGSSAAGRAAKPAPAPSGAAS
jgi:hypothetical protein